MRSLHPAAACLAAILLANGPAARAEPASGWVDPPAKAAGAKAGEARAERSDAGKARSEPDAAEVAATDRPRGKTEAGRGPRHGVAEADRPSRHARGRHRAERREAHRRMAVSSEIDAGGRDPRFPGWAGTAQRLTEDYLDSVSSPNGEMLSSAPRFYGERVRFHGRTMSTAALIAEKRRFVRRWPERRYEPQGGTMRTACDAAGATCRVNTVMAFRAENPARGARSQGLSELTLTISFAGERPVIVGESSRVLRRGTVAGAAGRSGGDGA